VLLNLPDGVWEISAFDTSQSATEKLIRQAIIWSLYVYWATKETIQVYIYMYCIMGTKEFEFFLISYMCPKWSLNEFMKRKRGKLCLIK
jgi:hypothetical protein